MTNKYNFASMSLLESLVEARGNKRVTAKEFHSATEVLFSLCGPYQNLLVGRHILGLSLSEIAKMMRCPEYILLHSYENALAEYTNELIKAGLIRSLRALEEDSNTGCRATRRIKVSFSCPLCEASVKLPTTKDAIIDCPTCHSVLQVVRSGTKGLVVKILNPKVSPQEGSDPRIACGKLLTPDECYNLLGVSPDDPPDVIKGAYMKQIQLYHPDKVDHLGTDLKAVAEEKSKKLNEAWAMIRPDANL